MDKFKTEISDDDIFKIYWKGWNEENDVYAKRIKVPPYTTKLERVAYDAGRSDFRMGDDLSHIDAIPWEITLKEIKDAAKL